jgi:hypothetical protein
MYLHNMPKFLPQNGIKRINTTQEKRELRQRNVEPPQTKLKEKSLLELLIACGMVFISLFVAKALVPQEQMTAPMREEGAMSQGGDSMSAIPIVMLMLPIASVVAYVLGWRTAKNEPTH